MMKKTRMFARIENGSVAEVVPPVPLSDGWKEVIPRDGDVRRLYGYPEESWIEITDANPVPGPNWIFSDGVFTEPAQPESPY